MAWMSSGRTNEEVGSCLFTNEGCSELSAHRSNGREWDNQVTSSGRGEPRAMSIEMIAEGQLGDEEG